MARSRGWGWALLFAVGACGACPAEEEEPPPAVMALSCRWNGNVIEVALTNTGDAPVVVDGELLVGLHWQFYDENKEELELADGAESGRTIVHTRGKRLRFLRPGETVTRTLNPAASPLRFLTDLVFKDGQGFFRVRECQVEIPAGARYLELSYVFGEDEVTAADIFLSAPDKVKGVRDATAHAAEKPCVLVLPDTLEDVF